MFFAKIISFYIFKKIKNNINDTILLTLHLHWVILIHLHFWHSLNLWRHLRGIIRIRWHLVHNILIRETFLILWLRLLSLRHISLRHISLRRTVIRRLIEWRHHVLVLWLLYYLLGIHLIHILLLIYLRITTLIRTRLKIL